MLYKEDTQKNFSETMLTPIGIHSFCKKIIPFLKRPIADVYYRRKLLQFKYILPKNLTSHILLFESNLSKKTPAVDLSFSLIPSSCNFSLLKSCFPTIDWSAFSSIVNESESPSLWVECDISSRRKKEIIPNLFPSSYHFELSHYHSIQRLISNVNGLTDKDHERAWKETMEQCLTVCQKWGYIIWSSGCMFARNVKSLRLIIYCNNINNTESLLKFLQEIGYAKDCSNILSTLEKIRPYLDHICFSLDIGEMIGDRLGIECYLRPRASFSGSQAIFTILNEERLIYPSKAGAVTEWVGSHIETEPLPEGSNRVHIYHRNINHFKLISYPGAAIEAKVYLAAWHQEIPESSLIHPVLQQQENPPLSKI